MPAGRAHPVASDARRILHRLAGKLASSLIFEDVDDALAFMKGENEARLREAAAFMADDAELVS